MDLGPHSWASQEAQARTKSSLLVTCGDHFRLRVSGLGAGFSLWSCVWSRNRAYHTIPPTAGIARGYYRTKHKANAPTAARFLSLSSSWSLSKVTKRPRARPLRRRQRGTRRGRMNATSHEPRPERSTWGGFRKNGGPLI